MVPTSGLAASPGAQLWPSMVSGLFRAIRTRYSAMVSRRLFARALRVPHPCAPPAPERAAYHHGTRHWRTGRDERGHRTDAVPVRKVNRFPPLTLLELRVLSNVRRLIQPSPRDTFSVKGGREVGRRPRRHHMCDCVLHFVAVLNAPRIRGQAHIVRPAGPVEVVRKQLAGDLIAEIAD